MSGVIRFRSGLHGHFRGNINHQFSGIDAPYIAKAIESN